MILVISLYESDFSMLTIYKLNKLWKNCVSNRVDYDLEVYLPPMKTQYLTSHYCCLQNDSISFEMAMV